MAAVPRRSEPRKFLDASLVPLEHALRARADVLDERATSVREQPQWETTIDGAKSYRDEYTAAEFRALAAELHHW